jgi:Carbohydrate binding domain
MKNKMNEFYKVGLLSLTFFATQAQTNLVVNGSFEAGITNNIPASWQSSDQQTNISMSLVTTGAQQGTKALRMSNDGPAGKAGDIVQIVPGIVAGSKYEVSFWYKFTQPEPADGSVTFRVLQWFDATDTDVPPLTEDEALFGFDIAPYVAQNVWVPFTITATAPITAKKLFLNIASGGVINVHIDDVKVVKQSALGINTMEKNTVNMYAEGNSLYVATQEGEQVSVYNLMGQKVTNVKAQNNSTVTTLNDLPINQMLIVRVDNKSGKVILK